MNRAWLVVGLAIAALGAVAAIILIPQLQKKDPTHALTGSMTLLAQRVPGTLADNAACAGSGGYDDIRVGTDVVVKDDASKIVASNTLSTGKVIGARTTTFEPIAGLGKSTNTSYSCEFDFSVPDVPKRSFYVVEISHRGGGTYHYDDLQARGWNLTLSLGP